MRRRRRGAGRPRKQGMKRYANGRIRRGAENRDAEKRRSEREALRVGLSARMRHHGVTRAEARNPAIGYELGRLVEHRRSSGRGRSGITPRQHDAALGYARLKAAFNRICEGPKAPCAVALNRVNAPGLSSPAGQCDYEDGIYERRIRRRYHRALAAISSADESGLQVLETVLDDKPLDGRALPVLRAVLDAVAEVLGI